MVVGVVRGGGDLLVLRPLLGGEPGVLVQVTSGGRGVGGVVAGLSSLWSLCHVWLWWRLLLVLCCYRLMLLLVLCCGWLQLLLLLRWLLLLLLVMHIV